MAGLKYEHSYKVCYGNKLDLGTVVFRVVYSVTRLFPPVITVAAAVLVPAVVDGFTSGFLDGILVASKFLEIRLDVLRGDDLSAFGVRFEKLLHLVPQVVVDHDALDRLDTVHGGESGLAAVKKARRAM